MSLSRTIGTEKVSSFEIFKSLKSKSSKFQQLLLKRDGELDGGLLDGELLDGAITLCSLTMMPEFF